MTDKEKRPAAERGADDGGGETNVTDRLRAHHGFGWHGHDWGHWCPCGHDPADDETCVRHQPLGEPVDYADSAVGLATVDGTRITSLRQWQGAA